MTKFTKGNWVAHSKEMAKFGFNRWDISCGVGDEVQIICTVRNGCENIEERQANANLISAAPKLYEALDQVETFLQSILEDFENYDLNHEDFKVDVFQRAENILTGDVLPDLMKARGE